VPERPTAATIAAAACLHAKLPPPHLLHPSQCPEPNRLGPLLPPSPATATHLGGVRQNVDEPPLELLLPPQWCVGELGGAEPSEDASRLTI